MKLNIISLGIAGLVTSGCLIGTAVNVAGEGIEAGIEITGATVKTTAGVTGAVIGGTVDAVIPGDQSKKSED